MANNLIIVGNGEGSVNTPTGTPLSPRSGGLGDMIVSEYRPCYSEATKRNRGFSASIQSVATTTVGLATTYTGLCISNPITSTVDLHLIKASVMQSIIQATQPEAYAIAVGFNSTTNVTHTASLTVKNNLIGSTVTGQGLADTSATLPTAPTYHTFVHNTATATQNGPGTVVELNGSIILPPGAYACWVTPGQASVAGMWFSFSWLEFPTVQS